MLYHFLTCILPHWIFIKNILPHSLKLKSRFLIYLFVSKKETFTYELKNLLFIYSLYPSFFYSNYYVIKSNYKTNYLCLEKL